MTKHTPGHIDIVFDRMPGSDGCTFIEVENAEGESIRFGEWVIRPDGLAALRIVDGRAAPDLLEALKEIKKYNYQELSAISQGMLDDAIAKAEGAQ